MGPKGPQGMDVLCKGTRIISLRTSNLGSIESFSYDQPDLEGGYYVTWDIDKQRTWWIHESLVRRVTPLEELAQQAE